MDLAVNRVQNRANWKKSCWNEVLHDIFWTFNSSSGQVQKGECKKASVNLCDTPIVFQLVINVEESTKKNNSISSNYRQLD